MDHHCPWLNQCIGHFNHRYFFFFCVYTWLGTIFVMIFGVWVAIDHFFPNYTIYNDYLYYDSNCQPFDTTFNVFGIFTLSTAAWRHRFIVIEAIITILLFLLLGLLIRYHAKLITNGETCIERHENRKAREHYRNLNRHYRNPYDFGSRTNWRIFLGFDRNRNPWRHILLPSSYPPIGDGFSWTTIHDLR